MTAAKKKPGKKPASVKKAPATGKHPGGRPEKYDEQTPITAGWLARDGKTNDEIATALGISRSTLQEWIKKYPKLSDAIKTNKEVVDNRVVDALLKSCLGYDYEKTEIEVHVTDRGDYQ
jgi:DNA invertase Pin-like site-specific DNA recombinase